MELGGNLAFAKFSVDERGSVRAVGVQTSMVQAHGAGFFVEMEIIAQAYVSSVSLPRARTCFSVSGDVGGCVDYGPVDMAGELVNLVYGLIGFGLGTCRQKQGEV